MTRATLLLIAKAGGALPPDPDVVPESWELIRERLARAQRGMARVRAQLGKRPARSSSSSVASRKS